MILDYAPCGSPKFYNFGKAPGFSYLSFRRFNFYEKVVEKRIIKLVKNPVQRGALIGTFNVSGKLLESATAFRLAGPFYHKAKQLASLAAYLKSQPPVDSELIAGILYYTGPRLLPKNQKKSSGPYWGRICKRPSYAVPPEIPQRLDYNVAKGTKVTKAGSSS